MITSRLSNFFSGSVCPLSGGSLWLELWGALKGSFVVLLWNMGTYCCGWGEVAWVECRMMRMCGVRLVDRMSTDVLQDRVGVTVKIKDVIIWSHLQWYGHVMHGDINSQIHEVMEVEISGKRKKGWPRKSLEECLKKDFEWYGLRREDVYDWKKWQE